MQLSAKGLLKPFSATPEEEAALIADASNESTSSDDSNDEDSTVEDDDDSSNEVEDKGEDDEDDPFDELGEEEKAELIEQTTAVRMTLNKVCFLISFSSNTNNVKRFENCLLPLSTPPPSCYLPGEPSVFPANSRANSSRATSKPDGTPHMI
jgi:hypothetical protein